MRLDPRQPERGGGAMIALQAFAALLLVVGSGLIILALLKLDRDEDEGRVSPGHWSQKR